MNDEFAPNDGSDHGAAWIVDALRAPTQPGELDGGETAVGAMTAAVAATRAATYPHPRHGRRNIATTLIGVAIVGIGGVAAAGTASISLTDNAPMIRGTIAASDTTVAATTTTFTTTTTTTTTTMTVALQVLTDVEAHLGGADDAAEPSAVDSIAVSEEPTATSVVCEEGNHGGTVSSIAHAVPPGPDHGPAVASAAQSDCGKTDAGGDSPTDPAPTPPVTDTTEVVDTTAPDDNDSGHANANANANASDGAANAGDGAANAGNSARADGNGTANAHGNEHANGRSTGRGSAGEADD